jgi:hypothetical protein
VRRGLRLGLGGRGRGSELEVLGKGEEDLLEWN